MSPNPSTGTHYFLPPTTVDGYFSISGKQISFAGTVTGHSDGRFAIEIDDQDWSGVDYVAMHSTRGTPGMKSDCFSLHAASADGKNFTSDTVWFTYLSNRGAAIDFLRLTVTLSCETEVTSPRLAMRLRGLRNFGPTVADTPLGVVDLRAPHDTNTDEPAGVVLIEAPTGSPSANWRQEAESFLVFLRCGMALAHGGRLQMPLLEYYECTSCTATYYAGRGSEAELGVHHPLANTEYFQAVTRRYFIDPPWPDLLWEVQGWMHLESTHDEVRVLSAVIALETLLRLLPAIDTVHINKATFKPIKDHLHKALSGISGLSPKLRKTFADSISSMNKRPLRNKVEAILDHYQVRKDDIIGPLKSAINERNKIVHEGQAQNPDDTWDLAVLTREAVTRILLKEMRYEGTYECYLGGRHTRMFPSCQPTT